MTKSIKQCCAIGVAQGNTASFTTKDIDIFYIFHYGKEIIYMTSNKQREIAFEERKSHILLLFECNSSGLRLQADVNFYHFF